MMNKCKKLSMACLILVLSALASLNANAQKVGKVKRKAKAYEKKNTKKNNTSHTNNYYNNDRHCDEDEEDESIDPIAAINAFSVLLEVVFSPLMLIGKAQGEQLARSKDEVWINSMELKYTAGYEASSSTLLTQPKLRANWGLISTELRLNKIRDKHDSFSSIDWQLVKFNVINNDVARMSLGIGISNEEGVKDYHTEKTIDLSIFLMNRQLIPTFSFRQSGDGNPRREISAEIEYRFRSLKDSWNLSLQFTNQNWYGESFNYIGLGIGYIIQ